MKNKFIIGILISGLVFTFVSCEKKDEAPELPTLEAYLATQPDLGLFSQALDKAQLQDFKTGPGPFTWIAPTDQAFALAGITRDSLNRMTSGAINYILLYHLFNSTVTAKDMIAQNSFARTTQMGGSLFLAAKNDSAYVNGFGLIRPDVKLSNGVVHVSNRLHTPPNLRGTLQAILNSTGQHALFIAALTKANRWAALSTSVFTVIAPTDDAMNSAGFNSAAITAAPTARIDSLMRYHLFSSARLFTNDFSNGRTFPTSLGATLALTASSNGYRLQGRNNATPIGIIDANRLATNGVVQVTNGVLRY